LVELVGKVVGVAVVGLGMGMGTGAKGCRAQGALPQGAMLANLCGGAAGGCRECGPGRKAIAHRVRSYKERCR